MKTQEIKIETPKGFEIDKEKSTFEKIVFKEISNNFEKILKYHNTNQEEFDKTYENIPFHVKAYAKESMLASFYNNGWAPNFQDDNERKYYPWFWLDNFRLHYVRYDDRYSCSCARLLWKNEKDLREAIELYPDVFKENRLGK